MKKPTPVDRGKQTRDVRVTLKLDDPSGPHFALRVVASIVRARNTLDGARDVMDDERPKTLADCSK